MSYDLDRFIKAQTHDYEIALSEIRAGHKRSHWIWYIFPQIKGLGMSAISEKYGIDGKNSITASLIGILKGNENYEEKKDEYLRKKYELAY